MTTWRCSSVHTPHWPRLYGRGRLSRCAVAPAPAAADGVADLPVTRALIDGLDDKLAAACRRAAWLSCCMGGGCRRLCCRPGPPMFNKDLRISSKESNTDGIAQCVRGIVVFRAGNRTLFCRTAVPSHGCSHQPVRFIRVNWAHCAENYSTRFQKIQVRR